jgi:RNA polymerase sigma-70 factor (ECF subfamily)
VRGALNDRLVAALVARHPDALDELLQDYGAEIQAVAYIVLRDAADAEEVTADTLLTAWRKVGDLREPDKLRPWLLRTATRLALRRRFRARPQSMSLELTPEVADRQLGMIDRIALSQALDGLPPRMRAVVALHHVAGLTVAETAEAVGRSQNTVKSQLREALARLRRELADTEAPGARSPQEELS